MRYVAFLTYLQVKGSPQILEHIQAKEENCTIKDLSVNAPEISQSKSKTFLSDARTGKKCFHYEHLTSDSTEVDFSFVGFYS